jgi:hypothetical protein
MTGEPEGDERQYRWWQYKPVGARRLSPPPARPLPVLRLADMRPGAFYTGLCLVVAAGVAIGVLAAFWIAAVIVAQHINVLPPAPTSNPFPTFPVP